MTGVPRWLTGQRVELVALDRLTEHPRNPNRGDTEAVQSGIATLGFWGALIVQRSTGHILAGNTRYRALRATGATEAPVLWAEVDDRTAERILLADNRLATKAETDQDQLAVLLQELTKEGLLEGTGYDVLDVEALLAELRDPALPETEAGLEDVPVMVRLVVPLDRDSHAVVTDWLSQWQGAWGVAGPGPVLRRMVDQVGWPVGLPPGRTGRTGKRRGGASPPA